MADDFLATAFRPTANQDAFCIVPACGKYRDADSEARQSSVAKNGRGK